MEPQATPIIAHAIISGFQRLTQRSVKLVRWFRHFMWVNKPVAQMHARLRLVYAKL